MTKTLQKRFVVTAMTAITILLAVLVAAINAANCLNANGQIETILSRLMDSEGLYMPPEPPGPGGKSHPFVAPSPDDMMGARYFFVRLDEHGAVVHTDVAHIYAVSDEDAAELARDVYEKGSETGHWNQFRYQVKRTRDGRGSLVLFLDISLQRRSIGAVFFISLLAGLVCWGVMLLVVILLSRRAIAPVVRSMEKQKQFVTNAGHEIKTPLAIILANTDALEIHGGETKWSKNIRAQTIRLNALMQGLLSLAKLDEENVTLPMEEVSLSLLLEEALGPCREGAAEKGIRLEAEIPGGITLRANRDSIVQMVSALLDNAVKYTPDGGAIGVRLRRERRGILLQVENTCGAPPEADLEKLFDRFYRGDAARTQRSGGYGIGLSAARAAAEAHGGRISAAYEEGRRRIVFTVRL